jgi:hypothetical protein
MGDMAVTKNMNSFFETHKIFCGNVQVFINQELTQEVTR